MTTLQQELDSIFDRYAKRVAEIDAEFLTKIKADYKASRLRRFCTIMAIWVLAMFAIAFGIWMTST